MTTPASQPSIMTGQEAQDQAILPTRVAISLCLRGIRTRLGRSIVTLTGVSLGIAFLMSVISSFHIKEAMREDAELARDVDRQLTVLRSEVGMLADNSVLAVCGALGDRDRAFLRALIGRNATVSALGPGDLPKGVAAAAPAAAEDDYLAVVLLGNYEPLLTPDTRARLLQRRVYVFDNPTDDLVASLAAQGITIRRLGIELREDEVRRAALRAEQARYRVYWIVVVSLLITVGGITNAMLMSVTERFREIATMKCLGALSTFVLKLFLIESSLMGFAGALCGIVVGILFPLVAYSYTYGTGRMLAAISVPTLLLYAGACVVIGVVLSVVAGIYPARVAAKMIPAQALATNV